MKNIVFLQSGFDSGKRRSDVVVVHAKSKSDVRLRNEAHPLLRQMDAMSTSRLCAWPKLERLVGADGGGGEEVLDKIELSLSNCTSLCNRYTTHFVL